MEKRLHNHDLKYAELNQKLTRIFGVLIFIILCQTNNIEVHAQSFISSVNPYSLTATRYDNATPTFGDLDGDGDLDILTNTKFGFFYYYENVGNDLSPDFAARIENPFSLTDIGDFGTPVLVDLDTDGDLDIMLGDNTGVFKYFENIGTAVSPNYSSLVVNPFSLTDVGSFSKPAFGDLDNDGDLDMLVTETFSLVTSHYYFENIGTSTNPLFGTVMSNPFSLSNSSALPTPVFGDLDGDGDLDLLTGLEFGGGFIYYENTGTINVAVFASAVSNPFSLTSASFGNAPTIADLDNDGDLDILSGNGAGNLFYYENQALPITITWDGETSSDWSTATNWDGDILPSKPDKVVIPELIANTNYPVITSDAEVSKLEIATGASLEISSGSLQALREIKLEGGMTVQSGASLVPLGSISGSGSATINRNTTFGINDGKYSAIGSPVLAASTNDLGSVVYKYDENVAYGEDGGGRFDLISVPEVMSPTDAYFSANTGSVAFLGTPNSGNFTVPLIFNQLQDGGLTNAGFNLISNPYPSSITFRSLATENTNIEAIYLWDDGGSNAGQRANSDYITVTGVGAAGGSSRAASWDGNIRSAQGFFVKATTGGTLNFTPSMMTTGNNTDNGFFRKENSEPEVLRLSLSSNNGYNDILIGFSEDATEGFDRMLDAFKIKGNSDLQLYSRMGEEIMAIQALLNPIKEITIDLGFDAAEAGRYTFNISDLSLDGFNIYLEDHLLGLIENLSRTGTYSFETSTVADSDRFSLVFSSNNVLAFESRIEKEGLNVYTRGDELHVSGTDITDAKVKIYNLSGATLYEFDQVRFEEGRWSSSFSEKGLLIITIETGDQLLTKKFWK